MRKKLKTIIHDQLVQGCTPEALALTFAIGVVMGVFPILGLTTLFCIGLGIVLKLNQPLLQTINYAMTPIHILMLPVFFHAGQMLSDAEAPSLNPKVFIREFWHDMPLFFAKYSKAALLAILVWLVVAPFLGSIVYFSCRYLFAKIKNQIL